jgi:hypothetical protein
LYVPTVVMPQRGNKSAAETAQERAPTLVALRRQHSAVESEINSLEHHGLNRCLDVGWAGDRRYVGYGALSDNLHVIGRALLARERARAETMRAAAVREPLPRDRQDPVGSPWHPLEDLRMKPASPEKVVAAVVGRTHDEIDAIQRLEGLPQIIERKVWRVGPDEDTLAESAVQLLL